MCLLRFLFAEAVSDESEAQIDKTLRLTLCGMCVRRWVTHLSTSRENSRLVHKNTPAVYGFCFVENVHLDWFNWAVCTREHLQLDIDTFRFDAVFAKPRALPPIVCLNGQTDFYIGYPRHFAAHLPDYRGKFSWVLAKVPSLVRFICI